MPIEPDEPQQGPNFPFERRTDQSVDCDGAFKRCRWGRLRTPRITQFGTRAYQRMCSSQVLYAKFRRQQPTAFGGNLHARRIIEVSASRVEVQVFRQNGVMLRVGIDAGCQQILRRTVVMVLAMNVRDIEAKMGRHRPAPAVVGATSRMDLVENGPRQY